VRRSAHHDRRSVLGGNHSVILFDSAWSRTPMWQHIAGHEGRDNPSGTVWEGSPGSTPGTAKARRTETSHGQVTGESCRGHLEGGAGRGRARAGCV